MTAFTINPATPPDVAVLLAMIRELAEFEHLAHELEVTADSLRASLFAQPPVTSALLAWMSGSAAGYEVYFRTFSTFVGRSGIFLDDIYVRPEFRNRGLGRALLQEVARRSIALGGGRVEWIALRWNENALRFYRSLGAKVMDEWGLLRMNAQQVRTLISGAVKENP
jgi:GNAT superfamily N-acetyltransferase